MKSQIFIYNTDLRSVASISPEHGLHIDDGFGISHVVFFCAHRALLIHHHQIISVQNATL